MSIAEVKRYTPDDLLIMPDAVNFELVDGELVARNMNVFSSLVEGLVFERVQSFCRANFVSQGTIEQGMLEVLRFKKSLFAGVLDGGETTISFGGSRLTKFMQTVEETTTGIPHAAVEETPIESTDDVHDEPAPSPSRQENPWTGLLEAGLSFLQPTPAATSKPTVIRDAKTGGQILQIPLPKPEVLREVTDALQKLLTALRQ